MQLNKIKLAGFKSFVDPTVVLVPSKLVAVVGPNGCGKSNIIDAVSWVMGESSAKYLRGESLTDVIFNGSSTRKPVGQASVELIFDNQNRTLGGELGAYAEISIRRVITREADSTYYLNGTRCRRRDIVDIFLGTGLGPRSYSIIGQNMISRIIEAKPDDMRVYLEEAAGVSKYKERRRETENRINHTKENLDRLNDIRTELDKQLAVLQRQANAAEKFKILKEEERVIRAQWLGIQWRELDTRLVQLSLQIHQQEAGLAARQAEMGEVNLHIEKQRELQHTVAESFQKVQRDYYAIGNDITRVEQEIRHTQARQQQLKIDVDQVANDWENTQDALVDMQTEFEELTTEGMQLEPHLAEALQSSNAAMTASNAAEESMQNWQNRFDEFNQVAAKTTQTAQVEQTRIQHLEQRIAEIKQQQLKLLTEQQQIDSSQLENELVELSEQALEAATLMEDQDQTLESTRDDAEILRTEQKQLTTQLDQIRNQLQRVNGQQSSLEALQQTALGQHNDQLKEWLVQHDLDKKPRLAQYIEVATGWEYAAEIVLGHHLQALCVESFSDITTAVNALKKGSLSAVASTASLAMTSANGDTLLSKITSQWSLESLLAGVYIAETQDEALERCKSLAAHESIVTRAGEWFGPAWLRVSRDDNPASGVFQREYELKQLSKLAEELSSQIEELENTLADNQEQITALELQRDSLQKITHQTHARVAEIQTRQQMQSQRLNEMKARAERFSREQNENAEQLEHVQLTLTTARTTWQQAMTELEQHADLREQLVMERDQLRAQLQKSREIFTQTKEHVQEQQIRLQTIKSQAATLQQTILRLQAQLQTLNDRKIALQKEADNISSIEHLTDALEEALSQRLRVEEEMQTARSNLEAVEQDLRSNEASRHTFERDITKYRDGLETLRLDSQSLKVRAETLREQLTETGFALENILKELPEEANAEEWHAQLTQTTQRITRLGPINLVAIEEYTACSERKEYLDKQYSDLQEGLTTLENAIAKIDKETRDKFKETFDKVNERFQELFPQIFGGGRAYLELTGDNLLDSGVTLMACPPGKRNSTIHLLSGGEKAMTAIALVFSIFHLNPAPFCLLDEVDAPLDDANIGRFCQLVKTMTDKTQFIFISHNKLAIEMGEHLMGVTMNEPGVSRLVSVNVEEAVSLAGA